MNPTFISLLAIAVMSIGCKDKDPVFCTKDIDLGEFTAQIEMPYDTFQYVQIVSENGDHPGISVHHPVMMDGPEMKNWIISPSQAKHFLKYLQIPNRWKVE